MRETIPSRAGRGLSKEAFARQDLTVNEYQVQIAVALTLTRRATGETVFSNRRFVEVLAYPIERVARRNAETEGGDEGNGEDAADYIGHGF